MYKFLCSFLLIFCSTVSNGQTAPITTYVPAAGQTVTKLHAGFEGLNNFIHKAKIVQITSESDAFIVKGKLEIFQNETLERTTKFTWLSTKNLIEKRRLNEIRDIRHDIYTISDFVIPCIVITVGSEELWIAMRGKDTSFPGIVLYKKKNKILIKLMKIHDPKQIRHF